ncbi:MAG: glycosyltransferase family 4 protein, partial [Thermoanaerobacterium sp.]|nr:glycosyltransferase family 4 protein [Thermoanaerobacterium sp.]
PESGQDEKVNLLVKIGAKHIQTYFDRRGISIFEDFKLIKEYIKIIKVIDPDIVLTYTIKPNVYGTFAASIYKKPVIMSITGVGSAFASSKLRYIVSLLYKYACRNAYFVFFQNESNYLFFVSNRLVKPHKSKIIPGSGVNIERFKPIEKQNKDGIIRFLFIGRIMKEKGIEEYLQAADAITKKYPNVEFQILGMFEEEKYKDVILNNKNTRIKYLGISDDVRNEIKEVDCIINPSYHEGMSNALLEGAAMAKPLIASNIPGCKEIIDDGINGYLFEVRNVNQLIEKIEKFLSLDDEAKNQMGQAGRKKIEKEFDRNIVINEYMKVIEDVIHRRLHT